MNETLHTKYGTAKIDKRGYYTISTSKEGNHKKLLHRLIWEDFYNTEIPKGYVIHHKNGNKTDNCILNLQLMREFDHKALHLKNKNKTETHRMKVSKARNSSGYFRVYKQKRDDYKQGFAYCYSYHVEGKHKEIKSIDIKKLEEKVKACGLPWLKIEKGGEKP